jgi:serine/threonine protein phosphatase PrpC
LHLPDNEQLRLSKFSIPLTKNKIDNNLSVSRAVGDFNYKEIVLSEGDQYKVDLEQFVVLASDGLVLDKKVVFQIITKFAFEQSEFEEDDQCERFTFNQMNEAKEDILTDEELIKAFEMLLKK